MTLFWHNHFATGYTKIAGALGAAEGARYMAAKPSEDPGQRARPDRDAARERARQLPRHPARRSRRTRRCSSGSTAGRTRRRKPQENFGREIMELFTMGVGNYTEADVYAGGARVHRLEPGAARRRGRRRAALRVRLQRRASTTPTAKTFSFPIYPDGSKTIPARAAADGMQDGIDFINALAAQPEHRALSGARSCTASSSASSARSTSTFVNRIAAVYLQSGYDMKAVMREVLLSPRVLGRRAPTSRATRGRSSSSSAR